MSHISFQKIICCSLLALSEKSEVSSCGTLEEEAFGTLLLFDLFFCSICNITLIISTVNT